MRKKVKVQLCELIRAKLNTLSRRFLNKQNIKICKLSPDSISNVNITYNKSWLKKTVKDEFKENEGNKKDKNVKNKEIVEDCERKLENGYECYELEALLNSTFEECFVRLFLDPEELERHYEVVKIRDCEEYLQNYEEVCRGFLEYFQDKIPNKRKFEKNKKTKGKKNYE
jgi:lysyl-tRNA synthetase class II